MTNSEATRTPRVLYLAMAFQFAVGGAIIPFVSILLRDRGLDYPSISRILLGACATVLVFPFFWGMLADRFISLNRVFTLLNLAALGALAVFARQTEFLPLAFSFAAFYACFNPTMTLINALCFHHMQNAREQFAWVRAWGSIGWIIPSLPLFIILATRPKADLQFALYLAMGLTVVMVIFSFFLPHTPPGARRAASQHGIAYWPSVRRLLTDANYMVILASFFLITASYSITTFYSAPFLEDLGIKRAWIGPIQSAGVVVEVIFFPFLPRVIERWSYATAILVGTICLFARHLLFAFSDNLALLSASYLLTGLVIVFYHSGISLLVNSLAGKEVRATAQTLLAFFGSGMGPLFANWFAGKITAGPGGLRSLFLFGSGLAGLATIFILARAKRLNAAAQIPQRT